MTIKDIRRQLCTISKRYNISHNKYNIDKSIIIPIKQPGDLSDGTDICPNSTTASGISRARTRYQLPARSKRSLLSPLTAHLSQDTHNAPIADSQTENSWTEFCVSPYFYFPSGPSSIAQQIGSSPRAFSGDDTHGHTLHEIDRKESLYNAVINMIEEIDNDDVGSCKDKDNSSDRNGNHRDSGIDDCLVEEHSVVDISTVEELKDVLPIVSIEQQKQDSAVIRTDTGVVSEDVSRGNPQPLYKDSQGYPHPVNPEVYRERIQNIIKNSRPTINTLEGAAKFADHCSRANKYKTIEHLDLLTGRLFIIDYLF